MGNFYVNHTIRAPQDQVADFLEGIERTAFVSPTIDGYAVVCDELCDDQDPSEILQLGRRLSWKCECPTLAVLNHDDDAFCYWVFDHGELIEEYDSESSQDDRRGFGLRKLFKVFTGGEEPGDPAGADAKRLSSAGNGRATDPGLRNQPRRTGLGHRRALRGHGRPDRRGGQGSR